MLQSSNLHRQSATAMQASCVAKNLEKRAKVAGVKQPQPAQKPAEPQPVYDFVGIAG